MHRGETPCQARYRGLKTSIASWPSPLRDPLQRTATGTVVAVGTVAKCGEAPCQAVSRGLKTKLSSRVTPRPRPWSGPLQRTATGRLLPDSLQSTVPGTVVAAGTAAKALARPVTENCDRSCRRDSHRGLAPCQAGYRDLKTELSSRALPSIRGNPSAPITIRQGRAGQGTAGHGMAWHGMACHTHRHEPPTTRTRAHPILNNMPPHPISRG